MSETEEALLFWLSSQGAYTGVPPEKRADMIRVLDQLAAERQRADKSDADFLRACGRVADREDRIQRLEAALREIRDYVTHDPATLHEIAARALGQIYAIKPKGTP